jgi:DNA-binding LacI/PurR family transcriptional regulator
MAVTMRDVADRAGVSIATVSFVLNNTKPVKAKTRERIEAAMSELGFQRNLVARALASRRTRILALAYPVQQHLLDRTGLEFVLSAAQAAKARDHHLVVWPIANDSDELATLVGQGLVDGVVLMEVQLDDARVPVLQNAEMPFALIGRTRDPAGLAYVDIDFETTITTSVDHLIELGHREIVLISGDQHDDSIRGYGPFVRLEAAFRRLVAGYGLRPLVYACAQNVESGRQAAVDLGTFAPTATAAVVMGDQIAVGLMAGLHRRGLRVPEDMSVICAIASEAAVFSSDPSLTIVTSPGIELGRLGVDALVSQLRGDGVAEPQLRFGELRPGESTGPASGGSPRGPVKPARPAAAIGGPPPAR